LAELDFLRARLRDVAAIMQRNPALSEDAKRRQWLVVDAANPKAGEGEEHAIQWVGSTH